MTSGGTPEETDPLVLFKPKHCAICPYVEPRGHDGLKTICQDLGERGGVHHREVRLRYANGDGGASVAMTVWCVP